MAAGVITLSSGQKLNVDSSSCFHVADSLYKIRPANQTSFACSSDPVTAGSTVTFSFSVDPVSVVYTIAETTASPSETSDLGSRPGDWASVPFLLQAVLVVAAVMLLFQGFRAGDKT